MRECSCSMAKLCWVSPATIWGWGLVFKTWMGQQECALTWRDTGMPLFKKKKKKKTVAAFFIFLSSPLQSLSHNRYNNKNNNNKKRARIELATSNQFKERLGKKIRAKPNESTWGKGVKVHHAPGLQVCMRLTLVPCPALNDKSCVNKRDTGTSGHRSLRKTESEPQPLLVP